MFQRMISDFKSSAKTTVRMTSLAVIAGAALLVIVSFLSAAAFIVVLQNYGPVEACLSVSIIFFVIFLLAITVYLVKKRREKTRAVAAAQAAAKAGSSSMLADPMVLTAGLQIVRAIGVKRLVPLLAIAGIAAGFLANRSNADSDDNDRDEV